MKFDPPDTEILDCAVSLVVSACQTAFTNRLECVILKGSAVKGDFIRGYSDFDFHVFLKPEATDGEKAPKVEGAVRFQKAFGGVDPEDFGVSQFQIYFINSERYPVDWVPPVAGTYRVLWGSPHCILKEFDDSTYLRYAKQSLSNVDDSEKKIVEKFVDKPNTQLPTVVRLLGASLKGYMYSVSMLLTSKPKTTLRLNLDELILTVEEGIGSGGSLTTFFEKIANWILVQHDYDYARETFGEGIKALGEIACWFAGYSHLGSNLGTS